MEAIEKMKVRESSYYRKPVWLIVAFATLLVSQANALCHKDSQCPGDQICILRQRIGKLTTSLRHHQETQVIREGICGCPVNHIIWKWSCLPLVHSLGDPCIVSHQCPQDLYCDPLNHVCHCPLHQLTDCLKASTTEETTMAQSGIYVTDSELNQVHPHHKEIFKTLLADMNKTIHATLNQTQNQGSSDIKPWTNEQIHTIIYLILAFCICIVFVIISAIYMRSLSEKRRSAAAIKTLLDMMAENRHHSNASVYTMDGVYNLQTHDQDELPRVLKADISQSLDDRFKLDPMEDGQVKLPSPHLSAPVLPPIQSRQRPRSSAGSRVETVPSSTSVAAISQNLSSMQHINSAASFPAEFAMISPDDCTV